MRQPRPLGVLLNQQNISEFAGAVSRRSARQRRQKFRLFIDREARHDYCYNYDDHDSAEPV